ncbi:MAG TPA: AAA family ATPase [Solirubrobacteraceae bacterium]|jgi:chromosome segregation protein|nr:AAA family ATPase [Solirubrobacteraceae bacterium]
MRLKSLTLDGFKSFPGRTRLEFGPGVSVVVGPNGSGKSNVTDAVLWAMGEQSPLAVRGQSMQDVIFGGGRGVQARSAAEVEIVLENSDGAVELPLSEISISRRLERNGEGGYRLNGARCRLSDVIEVLSDTGLGKETHSVISQGRVEAIVTSKPRDRRLLIEEAAGLGKHRKRRRRAQLKLERTEENLDRALDVEREARTRLRPLKRQAEAAELHERLERQVLEARWELLRDALRACRAELGEAEQRAAGARAERERVEASLEQVVAERGEAERALSERAERHDALSSRLYGARSARERLVLRGEQVAAGAERLSGRIERAEAELAELAEPDGDLQAAEGAAPASRIAALDAELAEVRAGLERQLGDELGELEREQQRLEQAAREAASAAERARAERRAADEREKRARRALGEAEREAEQARREAARVGAELAAANQFLRSHPGGAGRGGARALSSELRVQDGYELALAAALGGRLDGALVEDVRGAQALLDGAGPEGGLALLSGHAGAAADQPGAPPAAGARTLMELVDGPPEAMALARRLLANAWVVERLEDVPADFAGIAATRTGRVLFGAAGEVRQLAEGGSELLLARRNERERLIAATEQSAGAEQEARGAVEAALAALREAEAIRAAADEALRGAERDSADAAEAHTRAERTIERRRSEPGEGPLAVRRAELEGELAGERRQAEQLAERRRARLARAERLRAQQRADRLAVPAAARLAEAIAGAREAVDGRVALVEAELAADRQAAEEMAGRLRDCAAREAQIQGALRAAGERVTESEVAAQRLRDQAAEAEADGAAVASRLGLAGEDAKTDEPLDEQRVSELEGRVERLNRRREQLGPVNPLAQDEYAEAVEHVEELEGQRADLETALRELRMLIRETDRQIEETFEATFQAAARNFEELAGDVFPGGSGRLRLVDDELEAPRVLGGQPLPGGEDAEDAIEAAADAEAEDEESAGQRLPGVEIEITPAGKSTKRLTLLSGGEKSMTALAFLFAVFLARPCPFYILDEVEAALDDLNLDRFLALLRRYADRAQFIVITHQKRTMEAADWLFGVSMGGDGVSKVLSRRLPAQAGGGEAEIARVAEVA